MTQRISIILFISFYYGFVSGQLKQKQIADINPFQVAEKIELLYYQDRMSWWEKVYPDGKDLLENGKLNIPENKILERNPLAKNFRENLQYVLYEQGLCKESKVAGCYKPRYLLVFYKKNASILGVMEICDTCAGIYTSPGLQKPVVCPALTNALKFYLDRYHPNDLTKWNLHEDL
ncbi:hypothetical protein EIB75_10045 [Epilithonimonas vandammei]|uniref:Uncharacterized protein n=1 Tax=Epilithonimonas vandammei TaxID=2487072 RepID=A0A3G8ZEA4_9FLAO|nr:hypothetical protein [Epilithonimonas vandammei]AZI55568.1 hypothetical protein EIB75_10045 [Epilithonimonas vandammei]